MRSLAALFLLISAVLATSCDLRHNSLLPPSLDPKEYIMENTIRVYSDHLIKSENDDSYLYIPKESIADSVLWYDDTVSLRRAEPLAERDTLAFAEGSTEITDSYKITITRSGTEILLDSIPSFATLYTDLNASGSLAEAMYVQSGWRLTAAETEVYPYGSGRCFFDLDGNGDIALMDFHQGTTLQVEPSGKDVQALIATSSDYVYAWFPREYLQQPVTLSLQQELSPTEAQNVQAVFPGFALNTKILELQSENSTDSVPIIRYRIPASRRFDQQWARLNGTNLTTWQGSESTWLFEGDELISFLQDTGKYFLLTPLESQTSLELPLDQSFSQLFLQDLWLDLRDVSLSGGSLKLDLEPATQALVADYFSGTPFTLASDYDAFRFEFCQNGTLLESLPDELWIEFGFKTSQSAPENARLFQTWRSTDADRIFYKTHAVSYDESHFSEADSYVYAGYSSSGTYLFGLTSESASLTQLPCLKPEVAIQTARSIISWDDDSLPCTSLALQFSAPIPTGQPWLSGEPYNFTGSTSIMKLSASYRGRETDSLPANLFLDTYSSSQYQSIVNLSPAADYPKFVQYRVSAAFGHNGFVQSGSRLQISPAFAGYLIDGSLLSYTSSSPELALFGRMVFDNYDWEVYLDSSLPLAAGTRLRVTPKAAFTDTYGVFDTQYDLSPLAPIYEFKVLNNPAFYASYQPLVRIRQPSREDNLLFSVSPTEYYRVYSYYESDELDGWYFLNADGHAAFYLAYDAEYGAMHDNAPHTQMIRPILSADQDVYVSLYQAQFILPHEFLGTTIPLGSRTGLSATSGPAGVTALSAYQLVLTNAQGTPLTPNFYTVTTSPRFPYLYVPVPDYTPGQGIHLFFRNLAGTTTEYTRVDAFSENPVFEYMMVGNCAVCFVNNPGLFYTTP
jgi:hypothetical protein